MIAFLSFKFSINSEKSECFYLALVSIDVETFTDEHGEWIFEFEEGKFHIVVTVRHHDHYVTSKINNWIMNFRKFILERNRKRWHCCKGSWSYSFLYFQWIEKQSWREERFCIITRCCKGYTKTFIPRLSKGLGKKPTETWYGCKFSESEWRPITIDGRPPTDVSPKS